MDWSSTTIVAPNMESHWDSSKIARRLSTSGGMSITLSLLALAATFIPDAASVLQFDRAAITAGQWWRIVTGHFVHWNADHLCWDLAMFSILGFICERRDQRRMLLALVLATLAIPTAIWCIQPRFETYRGLSGLDSAMFTLLAASMLREKWHDKRWSWVVVMSGLLFGLALKILFEFFTARTMFVDSAGAGFEPVPLAHLVGGMVGLVIGTTMLSFFSPPPRDA